jgi:hypothetical protein
MDELMLFTMLTPPVRWWACMSSSPFDGTHETATSDRKRFSKRRTAVTIAARARTLSWRCLAAMGTEGGGMKTAETSDSGWPAAGAEGRMLAEGDAKSAPRLVKKADIFWCLVNDRVNGKWK